MDDDARSISTPMLERLGTTLPEHVVHIHTQQHMQQAALHIPCASSKEEVRAGLHRAREGSIPGGCPDSPEASTRPHRSFDFS